MRKYSRQILVLLCVLLTALVITRLLIGNTYRAEIPWDSGTALPELRVDDPEVARVENPVLKDGRLTFDVVPLRRGEVTVQVLDRNGEEGHLFLSVSRTRLVYNPSNGGFTGDLAVMILITVFVLLISAMMLHGYMTAETLPVIDQVIDKVDRKLKTLFITAPKGLIELYLGDVNSGR